MVYSKPSFAGRGMQTFRDAIHRKGRAAIAIGTTDKEQAASLKSKSRRRRQAVQRTESWDRCRSRFLP
jgi:hypothetical protein